MAPTYPKISLVTACYNHEKYIAETIESVISQNYPNLEYVVINDGSTDRSGEIIAHYKTHFAYTENISGYRDSVVPAINYGFSKTEGEIMGWLNSKNILLPKSLFVLAEVFSQLKEMEWLTGLATTINDRSEIISVNPYKSNYYDYLAGRWQGIQQESTLWRRALWQRAGNQLNPEQKWAFDIELWTRFFPLVEHYHLNTALGAYRKIPSAQSIRQKDVFEGFAEKAITQLQKNAPWGKRLLSQIPFRRLPLLRRRFYKTISYDSQNNRWRIDG